MPVTTTTSAGGNWLEFSGTIQQVIDALDTKGPQFIKAYMVDNAGVAHALVARTG